MESRAQYAPASLIPIALIVAVSLGYLTYLLGIRQNSGKDQSVDRAVAVLAPTDGSAVLGTVIFEREETGAVRVHGKVENLERGLHGFHIYQYGDARAGDGSSAGGHFAPLGHPQGKPDAGKSHAGDLGNIEANESGIAEFDFVDEDLELEGAHSIVGRGVVVHVGQDALTSQPSGTPRPRAAVGVVGIASPLESARR